MQQGFGAGWAAGHVDVDGHDLVDALGDRVGVPVGTAAVRAGAERDHVLRVGDLVVDPLERGGHLVGEGSGDDEEVGLARAVGERDHAQPDEVVLGGRGGDQLDRAARETEVHHPQGVPAAPVQQELDRLDLGQRVFSPSGPPHDPLRQA